VLEELAARIAPTGWVLFRSTLEMQRWFSEHSRPAVIAGSRHPGVGLSSVDIDYAAGCRHAAGRFLANGHRHLAIVRPETKLAGDLQSVAGFQSGLSEEAAIALHNGSVSGVCASLQRLFASKPRPTGLFVFHATHLLTVLGWLQLRGIRVGKDVSVICRDDEPFLESVIPTPARYTLNAEVFARKISQLVAGVVARGAVRPSMYRMLPAFVAGETLGRVPG
jgi:DNA-binding LacI/PurR family transcriptional regulator